MKGFLERKKVPSVNYVKKDTPYASAKRKKMETNKSALDVQCGGSHYKNFKIQPVEFIYANKIGFLEGNIIKYTMRHRDKKGREDLEKAKHYIDLLIELEYGKNEKV
jgi:hypothetical protein